MCLDDMKRGKTGHLQMKPPEGKSFGREDNLK